MGKYEDVLKICAGNDKTVRDRTELIIRDMCRVIDDMLDYMFMIEHFNNTGTLYEDKKNVVKNSLGILESDLDIYKTILGITDDVFTTKTKRTEKLAERIKNKKGE